MMTLEWTRPTLKLRRRAAPILVGLACGASFVIGMSWTTPPARALLVPIVTPVTVTVPAAQVVVTPAPAPLAVVEPVEPPPAPPPRALTPHVAAQCLIRSPAVDEPTCAWDEGFPAISRDGRLVATRYTPEDGGRGFPGESIHLIDVKTGRVVRDALVLSPDEYVEDPAAQGKLLGKVFRRAAAIQQVLDAGEFRTLIALGDQWGNPDAGESAATKIYAEIAGGRMRVVDPATATVIGQYTFGAGPLHEAKPDAECGGWELARLAVWWDPATRVTLGNSTYHTGGCMCPSETVEQVTVLR